MLAARVRLLIATLWVGSLWTVGYLVAPTLFATLPDRVLAGTIAGTLFRIEAWLSVTCALALILLIRFAKSGEHAKVDKTLLRLTFGMLVCTMAGYFGLQPFMATLREAAGSGGAMDAGMKTEFALVHGVSSAFYLVQSLLGVALILKVR